MKKILICLALLVCFAFSVNAEEVDSEPRRLPMMPCSECGKLTPHRTDVETEDGHYEYFPCKHGKSGYDKYSKRTVYDVYICTICANENKIERACYHDFVRCEGY